MNVLFDINHPAHFHLFKNFISYLQSQQQTVVITSRDKDVVNKLLDHAGFTYHCLSKARPSMSGKLGELLVRDGKLFKLHRRHGFDIAFGTSPSIAHLSLVSRMVSMNFNEDDDGVSPFYEALTYPFTTRIVCPNCLVHWKQKAKRVLHNSYHELAYLHPDNFTPDPKVLEKYRLTPRSYIIVRQSALQASHDIGAQGLASTVWERVQEALRGLPVVVTSEREETHRIDPWDMHHVLAYSKLLVSDSQTMSIEAAVLGVPSLRYSSFVGRSSVLDELEYTFGLTFGFKPGQDEAKLLQTLQTMLASAALHAEWQTKRERLLARKEDLNQWMINYWQTSLLK